MDEEEIKKEHPSLCYSCDNARKPAADSNIEKGYVGCTLFVKEDYIRKVAQIRRGDGEYPLDIVHDIDCKEFGEGWVDLKSRIFSKGSGIITNFQLVTLEVYKCSEFSEII